MNFIYFAIMIIFENKKLFLNYSKRIILIKDIILDQAGSIFNQDQQSFQTLTTFLFRDPRDIYTELKRKGYGYPGYDVKIFCNWYKLIMRKKLISLKMKINFYSF